MRTEARVFLAVLVSLLLGTTIAAYAQDDETSTTSYPIEEKTTMPSNTSAVTFPTNKPAPKPSTTTSNTTTTTTSTTTTTTTTKRPNKEKSTSDCPAICYCKKPKVDCSGRQLTQVPKFKPDSMYTDFDFRNNSIEALDLKQFPMADAEFINLSGNRIKTIVQATSRKSSELSNLKSLNLSDNTLDSLANMNSWKMPVLQSLDLSQNWLVRINESDFSGRASLKMLSLARQHQPISFIDGKAFSPLLKLETLDLSQSLSGGFVSENQLFAKNLFLKTINMSYNNLLEVPVGLRNASGLKELIFDGNLMTSLRQSDFLKLTQLKLIQVRYSPNLLRVEPNTFGWLERLTTLIISDNPRFFDFSPNAFQRATGPLAPTTESKSSDTEAESRLQLLDLSNNNITSMANPVERMPSVQLLLAGNPWDCSCQLEWMITQRDVSKQQPVHCKTPDIYTYLEVSQYFNMIDCQMKESSMQRFVVVLFLMFLFVLTVVVFVQKTDICRRCLSRHQPYGTIYYTKAAYPSDQI